MSRAATDRHLTGLAAVRLQSTLAQEAVKMCQAVTHGKQHYRALNPLGDADAELMAIINRGEFAINGFRNRDVRVHLYGFASDKRQERKQMAAVGRKLRLLQRRLIAKVSGTVSLCGDGKRPADDHGAVGCAPGKYRKAHSFGRLEICADGENYHV